MNETVNISGSGEIFWNRLAIGGPSQGIKAIGGHLDPYRGRTLQN